VELTNEGTNIDFAYPQPFSYSKNSSIFIPTRTNPENTAELKIFTPSMKLVYSGSKIIYSIDKIVVRWDGLDNNGNRLPSGIYIYAIKSGDLIDKGKLVILNE
jgi:flagellar hook assembly protein FlgD